MFYAGGHETFFAIAVKKGLPSEKFVYGHGVDRTGSFQRKLPIADGLNDLCFALGVPAPCVGARQFTQRDWGWGDFGEGCVVHRVCL